MILARRLLIALAGLLVLAAGGCEGDPPASAEGATAVPSGREVRFLDVITDAPGPSGRPARFRFIAPAAARGEDWSADMQALCDDYALPRTAAMVPPPSQIIIVIADREVPFGEAAPDAVQFFESYRIENGSCIWEIF